MKLKIHDAEVSEVMSELGEEFMPGVRLMGAESFEEHDVLARWEAEDEVEAQELLNVTALALAWLGV